MAMVFIDLVNAAVVSDSISEESIVVNDYDVIVCLPTGYGNSLIFESVPYISQISECDTSHK